MFGALKTFAKFSGTQLVNGRLTSTWAGAQTLLWSRGFGVSDPPGGLRVGLGLACHSLRSGGGAVSSEAPVLFRAAAFWFVPWRRPSGRLFFSSRRSERSSSDQNIGFSFFLANKSWRAAITRVALTRLVSTESQRALCNVFSRTKVMRGGTFNSLRAF